MFSKSAYTNNYSFRLMEFLYFQTLKYYSHSWSAKKSFIF